MANSIKGKVIGISQTMAIPNTSLTKRTLVLDCTYHDPQTGEAGRYNPIELEFLAEKAQELDTLNIGDVVEVFYYLQGREYTARDGQKRIFVSIRPTRIEKAVTAQISQPQVYQPQQQTPPPFPPQQPQPTQTDLPF